MPTKVQINKNLKLSEKLLDYLANNPRMNARGGASYIIITQKDSELNKMNLGLVKSLKKEGKKVIKALETNDELNPWKFSSI